MENYGGLIETMYSQYSENELIAFSEGKKIMEYKEAIDKLFLCRNMEELILGIKAFSEEERNYLSCVYLDHFHKVYEEKDPIMEAVKFNLENKIIDLYLSFTENYRKYFICAAIYNNIYVVEKLVSKVNKDVINNSLIIASTNGYLAIVKFILENASTIFDSSKEDAFISASQNGHLSVVNLLIENGVDINVGGDLALRQAAGKGHVEIVSLLIEKGVDIHLWDDYILKWAAESGHLEVVKLLVEKGASVGSENDRSLRKSSEKGHFPVVKFLLEKGASVGSENDEALRMASKNGHFTVVKLLIENGANIHTLNEWALRMASLNEHFAVVKLLIENGADMHAQDDYAFRTALKFGNMKILEFLL